MSKPGGNKNKVLIGMNPAGEENQDEIEEIFGEFKETNEIIQLPQYEWTDMACALLDILRATNDKNINFTMYAKMISSKQQISHLEFLSLFNDKTVSKVFQMVWDLVV